MSHTIVYTKIYAIKASQKGWSEYFKFYFDKNKAVKECRELQNWACEQGYKTNYRVFELTTEDAIIHTIND